MLPKRFDLFDPDTPVVFADGTAVFKELAKTYKTHKKGYFILAPSGAGKTHFVDNQKQKDWIDGDVLWMTTHAHPEGEWWLDMSRVDQVEQRSDVITVQAKGLGFWIVGSDSYAVTPDAIALPHWSTHKRYIKLREKQYDGGATSEHLAQVLHHRRWLAKFARKGVPIFRSVEEAAAFLAKQPVS